MLEGGYSLLDRQKQGKEEIEEFAQVGYKPEYPRYGSEF